MFAHLASGSDLASQMSPFRLDFQLKTGMAEMIELEQIEIEVIDSSEESDSNDEEEEA